MNHKKNKSLTLNRLRLRKYRAVMKLKKENPSKSGYCSENQQSCSRSNISIESTIDNFDLQANSESEFETVVREKSYTSSTESSDYLEENETKEEVNYKSDTDRSSNYLEENEIEEGIDDDEDKERDDEEQDIDVENLRKWALQNKINHTALTQLLLILKKSWKPNLPKSAKTFLGTTNAKYNIQKIEDADGSIGEFVYIGIAQGLQKCVNIDITDERKLDFFVNIDGVQLFKSSTKCFWPILGMIHSARILYEPFVIALYSGNFKPKQSHEYLREFVAELNRIQEDDIIISGIRFELCFKGFICDTLARAYIKSTVSHTAFKASEISRV